jgi:DNA-directed RNA polymerase subunit E'/Rpb7
MLLIIKNKVSIEAKYLDKKIEEHLLNKIRTTVVGKCYLEYGYILNVTKIIDIGSNTISSVNSFVVFDVTYEADVLKPEIGDVFSGSVCMIFQHGIFVNVKNKLKVLVPAKSMKTYVFEDDYFFNKKENTKITNSCELSIRITMIKYEKKEFSCIGELV